MSVTQLSENKNLDVFIRTCQSESSVLIDVNTESIAQHLQNITQFQRNIDGIITPQTKLQLQKVVQWACEFNIKLHPYSTGNNWGFGSKLPVNNGGFLLSLKLLNQITFYDSIHGFITIEPGVTQRQIYEFLKKNNSQFYLDVTGSSADSSVIGNALERGIAYNTLRVQYVRDLEVLLGDGQIFKTGYSQFENCFLKGHFQWSPGPNLDGLFFQSNMGIVTSMTYQLCPLPESEIFFNFNFASENLEKLVDSIRVLKQKYPWTAIVHIANRGRSEKMMQNLLLAMDHKINGQHNNQQIAEKALASMNRHYKYEWIAIASVKGPRSLTQDLIRKMKSEWSSFGVFRSFTLKQILWLQKVTQFLGFHQLNLQLQLATLFSRFSQGVPTNAALQRYYQPHHDYGSDHPYGASLIDQSTDHFIYCVPISPLEGRYARQMLFIAEDVCSRFGFVPEVTLNTISNTALEAVISITFNSQKKEAHHCIEELHHRFMSEGFYPYRLPLNMMDIMPHNCLNSQLNSQLKKVFDPKNIISPGRYACNFPRSS